MLADRIRYNSQKQMTIGEFKIPFQARMDKADGLSFPRKITSIAKKCRFRRLTRIAVYGSGLHPTRYHRGSNLLYEFFWLPNAMYQYVL